MSDPADPAAAAAAATRPVPDDVRGWVGQTRYAETADFPVERGYIWTSCASVENGNPLYWDDTVAAELTGGPIAPPSTLSLWFRPHHWQPGQTTQKLPLQVHFDLKERLGLPEAIMSDSEVVFHDPVRPGDVISTSQVLHSLSEPKTTKLGTGRFWVIDVPYRNQRDELVGVETFTGFGYVRAAAPPGTTPASDTATGPDVTGATRAADPLPTAAGASGDEASGAGASAADAHATDDTSAVAPPGADLPDTPDGTAPRLTLGDIAVGDVLPTLSYDVTATTVVLGALATRDWRPMHHDRDFAIDRNGARDIFLNTPNQQAWFERFVTDWSGPRGRPGRLHFRMRDSVYPGELMTLTGTLAEVETDATGCGWATVAVEVRAGGHTRATGDRKVAGDGARLCTTATLRIAMPTTPDDNPWQRRGDQWTP